MARLLDVLLLNIKPDRQQYGRRQRAACR